MTTIAYDGKTMAGDRRVTLEEGQVFGQQTKVFKRADGALVGLAGNCSACLVWQNWVLDGAKGKPPMKFSDDDAPEIIVVHPDGTVEMAGSHGFSPYLPGRFAIGSGAQYAMAAMECGRDAYGAVRIASRLDTRTGHEVDVVKLGDSL